MTCDSFSKTLQTFGANPDRWETDQCDALGEWAATDGADILNGEKSLDDLLNSVRPPEYPAGLTERIRAAVVSETLHRQILFFRRITPWASAACILCGFWLGWYQSRSDFADMQNYFNSMFDLFYEQY